jgi:hypothetical protein
MGSPKSRKGIGSLPFEQSHAAAEHCRLHGEWLPTGGTEQSRRGNGDARLSQRLGGHRISRRTTRLGRQRHFHEHRWAIGRRLRSGGESKTEPHQELAKATSQGEGALHG